MERNPVNHMHRQNHYHPTQQLFSNARNFRIVNPHFLTIHGDYHHSVNGDPGLHIFSQHIAPGATFDSSERSPPKKCHPGTREKAIKSIKEWIIDPISAYNVVWLYGSAGSGKSSIAQSIAELLWELYRDQYGASFFFAANDKMGRGDGKKFFSTLAYQLAVQFPSILPFISDALLNDPTLPTKSMNVQMKSLIINPILQASSWPTHAPTIIIDGLDECADSVSQTNILSLISQSIQQYSIPLRFLIASRPEYWIRDSFEVGSLEQFTLAISLNDIGDSDRDIEKYLIAEFADICTKYRRIMSLVEQPWPPTRFIRRFVQEASGQFIYASTVTRFIGHSSDFCDPREQLRILTTSGPHRAAAFSNLDALYAIILSRIPDSRQKTLKLFLGGVILGLKDIAIEIFLGVDTGEMALILDALSSLIKIQHKDYQSEEVLKVLYGPSGAPDKSHIAFCHLSFREFLQDEARSGQYFVDVTAVADQFMSAFFQLIGDVLEQKSEIEHHQTYTMTVTQFSWLTRCICNFPVNMCTIGNLESLLEDLCRRINAFLASDMTPRLYTVYLMHLLDSLLYWKDLIYVQVPDILIPPNLEQTIDRAGRRVVRYLANNDSLSITPLLYYVSLGEEFTVADFRMLPEVDLSNEIHHEALDIRWQGSMSISVSLRWHAFFRITTSLKSYIRMCDGSEWLTRWNSQAMRLLCLCTTVLRDDAMKFTRNPDDPDILSNDEIALRRSILARYFRESKFSTSWTRELLQNPDGRSILTLVLDSNLWSNVRKRRIPYTERGAGWGSESFAVVTILWLHGLLQDPGSKSVIEEYDESIPHAMSQAIAMLFDQHFLPDCQTYWYLTELTVYNSKIPSQSAIILLLTPSDDSEAHVLEEKKMDLFPICQPTYIFRYLLAIQHTLFGRDSKSYNHHPIRKPIIERSSWYPHLAAYLLNLLVKRQYHLLHPEFDGLGEIIDAFSPYIVECLPYAYPSEQNLAALRAMRHMSSKISPPWNPPSGFCSVIHDLLLKYDSSSVPIPDLAKFTDWLNSLVEENGVGKLGQ